MLTNRNPHLPRGRNWSNTSHHVLQIRLPAPPLWGPRRGRHQKFWRLALYPQQVDSLGRKRVRRACLLRLDVCSNEKASGSKICLAKDRSHSRFLPLSFRDCVLLANSDLQPSRKRSVQNRPGLFDGVFDVSSGSIFNTRVTLAVRAPSLMCCRRKS